MSLCRQIYNRAYAVSTGRREIRFKRNAKCSDVIIAGVSLGDNSGVKHNRYSKERRDNAAQKTPLIKFAQTGCEGLYLHTAGLRS